jgi:hypothetical protein
MTAGRGMRDQKWEQHHQKQGCLQSKKAFEGALDRVGQRTPMGISVA